MGRNSLRVFVLSFVIFMAYPCTLSHEYNELLIIGEKSKHLIAYCLVYSSMVFLIIKEGDVFETLDGL